MVKGAVLAADMPFTGTRSGESSSSSHRRSVDAAGAGRGSRREACRHPAPPLLAFEWL